MRKNVSLISVEEAGTIMSTARRDLPILQQQQSKQGLARYDMTGCNSDLVQTKCFRTHLRGSEKCFQPRYFSLYATSFRNRQNRACSAALERNIEKHHRSMERNIEKHHRTMERNGQRASNRRILKRKLSPKSWPASCGTISLLTCFDVPKLTSLR